MMTVKEARDQIVVHMYEGMKCPCCGQLCKLYRRALNSGMARSLIWLVRKSTDARLWVDIPKEAPRYVLNSREWGKMERWELVETQMIIDPKKRRGSGIWRPTEKGIDFVYRRIKIPKRVLFYNNKVIDFSKDYVDIVEALGTKFDYQQLMDMV